MLDAIRDLNLCSMRKRPALGWVVAEPPQMQATELSPASKCAHEFQQHAALFRWDVADFVTVFTGEFFMDAMQGVVLRRNEVVFCPPLGPLPVLDKTGTFAFWTNRAQFIYCYHSCSLLTHLLFASDMDIRKLGHCNQCLPLS